MEPVEIIISGLGTAVVIGGTLVLNSINSRIDEQRKNIIKIFETLADMRESAARTQAQVEALLRESRVEMQLGRIVSDMESEKRTRAGVSKEILHGIEQLRKG